MQHLLHWLNWLNWLNKRHPYASLGGFVQRLVASLLLGGVIGIIYVTCRVVMWVAGCFSGGEVISGAD